MMNKFLRLIINEPSFLLRLLVILACLGVIASEQRFIQTQLQQDMELKKEKALVMRIAEMEKALREHTKAMTATTVTVQIPKKRELTLQGTSIQSGVPQVLIDGQIYRQGDTVGDYQVTEINRGSVILKNLLTQATTQLQLPQPELSQPKNLP